MKAAFDKTTRADAGRRLTRRLPSGWVPEADFDVPGRCHRARWAVWAAAILTLSAFLGISLLSSRAQQYAALLQFTGDTNFAARPVSEWHGNTSSVYAVLIWTRPSEEGTNLTLNLDPGQNDERSLSFILDKEGTQRAAASLWSARVFTEDLMSSGNRDASTLRTSLDLTDHHVASVFRNTARDSLGDYVKDNYHPGGIVEIVRETFLDNSFDKRIVSPFSPANAGNPGDAYARKNSIHIGLRNICSDNPRAFVTFSDKAEIDVTRKNPSLTLRDPLYLDYSGSRKALITAIGVNYPDWQVDKWSIPNVGATLSYVYYNQSVNLTAGAGRCNFVTSQGGTEARYGEQVMLYTQCTF